MELGGPVTKDGVPIAFTAISGGEAGRTVGDIQGSVTAGLRARLPDLDARTLFQYRVEPSLTELWL